MSEAYTFYGDRSVKDFSYVTPCKGNKRENVGWYPRAPTQWTPDLQKALMAFFNGCDYPFRKIERIPFQEPLRSEVRRFFISLDAYIESPNPLVPYRDILYGSTYEDYALKLKRIRRKSYETTWEADEYSYPEWWKEVPSYGPIKDIGDIFNYNYLIFWKGDSDDYKWGSVPTKIKSGALKKLKFYCKQILPERSKFSKIDETEILTRVSSSISYDSKKNKKSPNYLLKPSRLSFDKRIKPGLRTVIQVGPENIRDTVILDPSSLNTIALIDSQLMEVLRVMSDHIHLTDKDRVTKRLKSLKRKCNLFIQRDLRKEGITKPREILKVLLEALHEEYPDIEVFGYTEFYDDFTIIMEDGEVFKPERGHGLGMANALTTLMQLSVHEWIIDSLIDNIPKMDGKPLCINDDFVVGFNDEYHLDSYWEREDEIFEKLSLLRAPEKSFVSIDSFVLAERYFTNRGEYEKISYQIRELLLPLACYNVCHAKSYFAASQLFISSELARNYLEEIYTHWGYEFFPHELIYPVMFGGWINEKYEGVDLSLKILDQLDYKSYVYRAFRAMSASIYKKGKGDYYVSPIITLYGNPRIPEEYHGFFDFAPISLITEKYSRGLAHSNEFFRRHWDKVYKVRRSVFLKDTQLPKEDLLVEAINRYPTVQFYPCESMINGYHPVDRFELSMGYDPYLDPNPKLALVSLYNDTMYEFKEEFSIHFTNRDTLSNKELGLYPKETQRALKNDSISQFFTGRKMQIAWPREGYDPNQDYINPIRMGLIVSQVDWGRGFPELKEKFRSPLIEKKRQVFGRFLSLEELLTYTKVYARKDIKKLLDGERELGVEALKIHQRALEINQSRRFSQRQFEEQEKLLVEERTREWSETMLDNMEGDPLDNFWIWNSAGALDQEIPSQVLSAFKHLGGLIYSITFPGLYGSREAKLQAIEETIRLVPNEILHYMIGKVNWSTLIDPVDFLDGEDDALGGFFDDEGCG